MSEYNGWKNYETWCVYTWISNETDYSGYLERAQEMVSESPDDAAYNLADVLKEEITDGSPIEEASMYADLIGAALSEVDWREIAEAILEVAQDTD